MDEAEIKLDYLQIFECNRDDQREVIRIVHRQEQPFFSNYYEYKITEDLVDFQMDKLWIIDDITHQTMLLPKEY